MLDLIARRLVSAVPLVAGVLTLTFLLLEAAPGRPVDLLLGDGPVPPEMRARIEAAYGLDQPAYARYASWIGHTLRGDLGWSLSRGRNVRSVLADALPQTIRLAAGGLAIQLLLGVILGALHVVRPGGVVDHGLGLTGLVLASVPTFWLGLMAILLFAVAIPIFPPSSAHSIGAGAMSLPARAADALWFSAWAPQPSSPASCARASCRRWGRGSSARPARGAPHGHDCWSPTRSPRRRAR